MGLWIGVSVLTVAEVFSLTISICLYLGGCSKRDIEKKGRDIESNHPEVPDRNQIIPSTVSTPASAPNPI